MNHDMLQSVPNPTTAAVWMTLTAGMAAALTAGVFEFRGEDALLPVAVTALLVWLIALASLGVFWWMTRDDPRSLPTAAMAAMAFRMFGMVVAAVSLALLAFDAVMVLMTVVAVYLPTMAVEILFLNRYAGRGIGPIAPEIASS